MKLEISLLAVLLNNINPFIFLDEFMQGDDIGMIESFHHGDLLERDLLHAWCVGH